MRVTILVDSLVLGGAQRQLVLLCQGLRKRGHVLSLLALNSTRDATIYSAAAAATNLEVVGKRRLIIGLGPVGLRCRIRGTKPDVVLTMLPYADLLGRLAVGWSGPPLVTTIRGRYSEKPGAWLWLDRLTMPWVVKVVFNGKHLVPWSQKHEGVLPEQVQIIGNGIDLSRFEAPGPIAADSEAARELIAVKARGAKVVVIVGRLHPVKRHDLVIDAMQKLPPGLDAVLAIAGDGPLGQVLRVQARGAARPILFLGDIADVPALLAAADALVLASDHEGMPNVVMEAMAARCAVVATRIEACMDLLPDARYGWLVPAGDVDAMAAALTHLLTDPSEAASRAARARERVEQEYGLERMLDRWEALLMQVADRN